MEEFEILTIEFSKVFIEIFNAFSALILIIIIWQIIVKTSGVDRGLYNDLFLDRELLEQTWIYISIAGAAFALNTLIKFRTWFGNIAGDMFEMYHFADLTEIIFLTAYIMGAYNNELILKSQRYAEEGTEIWKRIFRSR